MTGGGRAIERADTSLASRLITSDERGNALRTVLCLIKMERNRESRTKGENTPSTDLALTLIPALVTLQMLIPSHLALIVVKIKVRWSTDFVSDALCVCMSKLGEY